MCAALCDVRTAPRQPLSSVVLPSMGHLRELDLICCFSAPSTGSSWRDERWGEGGDGDA